MSKKSGRQGTATATKPSAAKPQRGPQQSGYQQQTQSRQQAQAQAATKPLRNDADYLAAQEAKKQARFERQAAARAEAQRRQRMARLRQIGIVAVALIVVGGLIAWFVMQEANKPGQSVAIMGDRTHIADVNSPHAAYSTDPPTSGPHVGQVPAWTVYTESIAKELQVHGLEDGGVIINYKPGLDQATIDKLASIAKLYEAKDDGSSHVLMSPYPGLNDNIVLTSWGRIDRIDTMDEARIRRFIDAYAGWDHHEGKEGQRIAK